MPRSTVLLALTCAALLLASPVLAEEPAAEASVAPNVRVTITLRHAEPETEMRYTLVCPGDGSPTHLTDRRRVPVPTISANAAATAGGAVPVTSYQYQDVGLRAGVRTEILPGGRILLRADLSYTTSSETGLEIAGLPLPSFGDLNRTFHAVLDPGAPLAILTAGGAAEAVTVEVAAELLD